MPDSRMLIAAVVLGAAAVAIAADDGARPPGAPSGADSTLTRPRDPLGNLKPYEERRYRIDLEDCGKQSGADRRICERTVKKRAATKSRRRAAGQP